MTKAELEKVVLELQEQLASRKASNTPAIKSTVEYCKEHNLSTKDYATYEEWLEKGRNVKRGFKKEHSLGKRFNGRIQKMCNVYLINIADTYLAE